MTAPFKIYFDQVLNRCEFDDHLRRGFLFFLSASMVSNNVNELMSLHQNQEKLNEAFNQLVFSYAVPNENDQHLFELNFQPLGDILYTINSIYLEQIQGKTGVLKERLKHQATYTLVDKLVEQFKEKKFTVGHNHQIITEMFRALGRYLNLARLDDEDSYKAGLAYYKIEQQKDFEGISLLFSTILHAFPPLYRALFKFPFFFIYDQNRLNANHLFSTILQFFYMDTNTAIARHIHAFHHYLFLKPNSVNLRREWKFEEENRGQMISQMMFNALNIRKSPIYDFREEFLNSDQFIFKRLKNQSISRQAFILEMQDLLENYYEMKVDDMVHEEYNHAEYLQFLAIMFYEVSAHAMLPDEITIN